MLTRPLRFLGILLSFVFGFASPLARGQEREAPWDYAPYRVMIWLVGPDASPLADRLGPPLHDFLDREFSAVWSTEITDAPEAVQVQARRGMDRLDFARLTAADPIIAVKRNHPEAPRIRIARDVATRVQACRATPEMIAAVQARGAAVDNPDLQGVAEIFDPLEGSLHDVAAVWGEESTEAVLLPRGLATTLVDPEPKLISLQLSDQVIDVFDSYDKLFIVRVDGLAAPLRLEAVELDCLMRLRGPVVTADVLRQDALVASLGNALIDSFAPTVRIEDAGMQTIVGRVRAAGLILDPASPAAVGEGDLLQPAVRKDDRNGNPILLQALDWSYLLVESTERATVKMKLFAGRAGGLQGRRNSRTHRMAFKVRPHHPDTMIRLHAQGEPDEPLRGYEFYEKDLETGDFQFLGRTDWDGRFRVEKTEHPLRLLYVKNGGAILAKLPTVPGQEKRSIADLSGDDVRLEAEAFVRGVQNAIIDLVALRDLYAARIRLRLKKGEVDTAQEMLNALRELPTKNTLTEALDSHMQQYDAAARGAQAAMIEQMFTQTRQMLSKHISPRVIRELESEVATAQPPEAKPPPDAASPPGATAE